MNKISKETIEEIMTSVNDKELRDIVRSYALTHPSLLEFLKEKVTNSTFNVAKFDYIAEVRRCFRHYMKSPRWENDWNRQPQFLDLEEVGKDLRTVLKRAELALDSGNPDIATETVFLILEEEDRVYETDFLCEREDWDMEDLCLDDCFKLMEKALKSSLLSKEQKLTICDQIYQFHRSELLDYTTYDLQEIIDSVRDELLTDEEHLAIMMRDFKNEQGWRLSSLACEIWDFLLDRGRVRDAQAFFNDNPEIDELRIKYIDYMQSIGQDNQVMKAVNDGIKLANKHNLHGLVRDWKERKLAILEAKGDGNGSASLCKELFEAASGKDALKYYHKAKQLVKPEKWPAFRDSMLSCNPNLSYFADSPLSEIYKEEQLLDRLYSHLINAKCNLLPALTLYAKEFTPQKQKILISGLKKEFQLNLGFKSNRKTYQEFASRLKTLAKTCPAGKELASNIVADYLSKFPNRPALQEELGKVKL